MFNVGGGADGNVGLISERNDCVREKMKDLLGLFGKYFLLEL